MVGYPSLDVIPKGVLLAYIPVGLAMNGAFLGATLASTKLGYDYIFEAESNPEEDILSYMVAGAGISITTCAIGNSLFDYTI
ncbi:MAG: hypothetical protein N4A31_02105 [Rickettsiales bacterium]|jgi:hypothetical protein|nr:hypothetical protein [Rickettsiales bacterium]